MSSILGQKSKLEQSSKDPKAIGEDPVAMVRVGISDEAQIEHFEVESFCSGVKAEQISPEIAVKKPDFPEVIWNTYVDEYPSDYLAAKARVAEHFLTLRDGRRICYTADGDRETGVPMICLHGKGEGKWMWLQPEPLPGIYQIAIDRMGYGESDSVKHPERFTLVDATHDIEEIGDLLGFQQFILCGFCTGTVWALQTACRIPNRIRGLILFGVTVDLAHQKLPFTTRVRCRPYPLETMNPVSGWCRCWLKYSYQWELQQQSKYDFHWILSRERGRKKAKKIFNVFKVDPFWVCSKVDSLRSCKNAIMLRADVCHTIYTPWPLDISLLGDPQLTVTSLGTTSAEPRIASTERNEMVKVISNGSSPDGKSPAASILKRNGYSPSKNVSSDGDSAPIQTASISETPNRIVSTELLSGNISEDAYSKVVNSSAGAVSNALVGNTLAGIDSEKPASALDSIGSQKRAHTAGNITGNVAENNTVSTSRIPVRIFQGQGDYEVACRSPAAPEFIRTLIPQATIEYVEGCGHLCIVGPYYITRNQITHAVENMPMREIKPI